MTPDELGAAVDAAVAHHRAGRLDAAEQGYVAALAVDPKHPRAAHNLGALLLQRGRLDEAVALLAAAYEADRRGQWWMTYVKALVRAGRFEAAEDVLSARAEQSAAATAVEVDLRQRWAYALMAGGEYDAAEAQLLQVQAVAPDDPHLFTDLGFLQLRQGRHEEARETLERALRMAPQDVAVLTNLGTALRRLGRLEEAEACYRQALAIDPENQAAVLNLKTLRMAEPPREPGQPADGGGSVLRGDALAQVGRLDEALMSYLAAAKQDRSPSTLAKVAANLSALGRHAEAMKILDDAVAREPDAPDPRYARAFARLASGDFAGGWEDYETRWRIARFDTGGSAARPELRSEIETYAARDSIAGADILLIAEQGVGDEIMFASMIPDLAAEARDVLCLCEPRLVGLFSSSFEGVKFVGKVGREPRRRKLSMGSLGRLYRKSPSDFPGTAYLKPREEVRARWAERLGPKPEGLRIGVSWRGGLRQTRMRHRSMSLEQLAPVLDLPGCEYVSLQYGDPREEVAAANAGLARKITVFPPEEIDDFEDLAGLVANLDVVVSVQTAVVHLSGALGVSCLTMVPHRAEWRYGVEGASMPWYGSVELFRQPEPEAWGAVLEAVRAALVARLAA